MYCIQLYSMASILLLQPFEWMKHIFNLGYVNDMRVAFLHKYRLQDYPSNSAFKITLWLVAECKGQNYNAQKICTFILRDMDWVMD